MPPTGCPRPARPAWRAPMTVTCGRAPRTTAWSAAAIPCNGTRRPPTGRTRSSSPDRASATSHRHAPSRRSPRSTARCGLPPAPVCTASVATPEAPCGSPARSVVSPASSPRPRGIRPDRGCGRRAPTACRPSTSPPTASSEPCRAVTACSTTRSGWATPWWSTTRDASSSARRVECPSTVRSSTPPGRFRRR